MELEELDDPISPLRLLASFNASLNCIFGFLDLPSAYTFFTNRFHADNFFGIYNILEDKSISKLQNIIKIELLCNNTRVVY
jgi:hypothetical protein